MTPNIFPVFRYQDAHAAIDWLIQAFGFQKHAEVAGPNQTIAHAELRFGPDVIGISSATPPTAANPWSSVRQGVYIALDNVDAHYEQARRAGAEIVMPIRDLDYGSREYSARDPEGRLWGFGTYTMGRGEGPSTLFPEVHYKDPRAALSFLVNAFGFTKTLEVTSKSGGVLHAELRLSDSFIMVGTAGEAGADWAGLEQLVCAYVSDVDGHYRRARAGGARIASEPRDTPFGARQYVARDLEGLVWLFGTYRPS